jgi:hypothetical protein
MLERQRRIVAEEAVGSILLPCGIEEVAQRGRPGGQRHTVTGLYRAKCGADGVLVEPVPGEASGEGGRITAGGDGLPAR